MKSFYGIIFIFLFSTNVIAQDSIAFSNSIKVTILPFLKPLTTSHANIIGLEYEKRIKPQLSIVERIEVGNFLNYTFYRYYNHLQSTPQDYVKTRVNAIGYHSITSLRYFLINRKVFFTYGGIMIDLHQYFIKSEKTSSIKPNEDFNSVSKIFQLSPGIEGGIRYVFKKRLTIDLNLSFYKSIYYNAPLDTYLSSQNGFWTSEDLMSWSVINIQIGYNF